ncbi:MAG: hypothetical protein GY762_20335 [Proteobacteria bacterium]|nr:hypothetical protein [Pseudomonadota bacterium]
MRETKKMRRVTSIPPVNDGDSEPAPTSQESGSRELFAKDRLKPLPSASRSDHQRMVKKPTTIHDPDSEKTTRSMPKKSATNS